MIKEARLEKLKGIKLVNISGRKRKVNREDEYTGKKKVDIKVYFSGDSTFKERRNVDENELDGSDDKEAVFLFDRRRNTVNAYDSNDVRAEIRVESYIALRERKAKKDLERKELQEKIRSEFEKKIRGMSHEQILRFLCPEAADALKVKNTSKFRKLLTRKLAEFHPDKHVNSTLESMLEIEEKYKLLLSLRDRFSE